MVTSTRDIYIVLTDTGTILTKIIRLFTKAPLNHASISFDSELREVYSFGRKKVNNPLIGGLVKENLYDSFFTEANCAVYKCKITREDYEGICQHVMKMYRNGDRYKYHLLGLIGIMINRKIEINNAFFCSQFVAYVFEQQGIPLLFKQAYQVTPADLARSPKLDLVYQGALGDYLPMQKIATYEETKGSVVV